MILFFFSIKDRART